VARKLLVHLEEEQGQGLARMLYALGVPQVGQVAARDLAQAFGSIEALASSTLKRDPCLRHRREDG